MTKLPKVKKAKTKTNAQLKKELDKIFSEYIRQKYANTKGEVQCYTCGKVLPWREIQNGHFVSRSHLSTRFDEGNCRPQCVGCNVFAGGRVAMFATNLEKEIGEGCVSALYKKAQQITKDFPYASKIEYYKEKIKQL